MNSNSRSVPRYSVGATWRAVAENGATAEVWLKERSVIEVWLATAMHPGGSYDPIRDHDWFTSRRAAVSFVRGALLDKTPQRPLPRLVRK